MTAAPLSRRTEAHLAVGFVGLEDASGPDGNAGPAGDAHRFRVERDLMLFPAGGIIAQDFGDLVREGRGEDHAAGRFLKPEDKFLNRTAVGVQLFLGDFLDGDGCGGFARRALFE